MGEHFYFLSLFSWWCLKVLSDILITGLYSWNFYDSEIFFFGEVSVPSDRNQTNLLSGALFSCRSVGWPACTLLRLRLFLSLLYRDIGFLSCSPLFILSGFYFCYYQFRLWLLLKCISYLHTAGPFSKIWQSFSWPRNSSTSWKSKFRCAVHKCPPLGSVLNKLSPVHTASLFSKIFRRVNVGTGMKCRSY